MMELQFLQVASEADGASSLSQVYVTDKKMR